MGLNFEFKLFKPFWLRFDPVDRYCAARPHWLVSPSLPYFNASARHSPPLVGQSHTPAPLAAWHSKPNPLLSPTATAIKGVGHRRAPFFPTLSHHVLPSTWGTSWPLHSSPLTLAQAQSPEHRRSRRRCQTLTRWAAPSALFRPISSVPHPSPPSPVLQAPFSAAYDHRSRRWSRDTAIFSPPSHLAVIAPDRWAPSLTRCPPLPHCLPHALCEDLIEDSSPASPQQPRHRGRRGCGDHPLGERRQACWHGSARPNSPLGWATARRPRTKWRHVTVHPFSISRKMYLGSILRKFI
jgi:hypothetical protein